ncbi:replication-relaxation family protein [Nocardia anaemiae]|uniref:replication-relaxation family protein n=1 Tax=Nocardia anaemiae TaxID=263910 RepID=UPI0007A41B5F|nr:replication-relaxation family protein [Nocardia anaemiae]
MIAHPDRQSDLRAPRPARPRASDTVALVARLTERDRWILRMLHEHRVLTTNHLAELAFPTPKLALRRLAILHEHRVIDRFRPLRTRGSAPSHWVLAPAGAAVLAAEAGTSVRELGYNHQQALAIAHSLHLTHTLGVSDWFTALTSHYRHHISDDDGARVRGWWSQTRCQRLWGDLARPDAFGRYTHPRSGTVLDFFLEYDLATTSLPRVATKLSGYSELARTTGLITPVLFWVPTTTREINARERVRRTWEQLPDPEAVPVATAAAELLAPLSDPSPADRVWLPLDTSGATRLRLWELASVWPRRTPPDPEIDTEDSMATLGGQVMLAPPPPLRSPTLEYR